MARCACFISPAYLYSVQSGLYSSCNLSVALCTDSCTGSLLFCSELSQLILCCLWVHSLFCPRTYNLEHTIVQMTIFLSPCLENPCFTDMHFSWNNHCFVWISLCFIFKWSMFYKYTWILSVVYLYHYHNDKIYHTEIIKIGVNTFTKTLKYCTWYRKHTHTHTIKQ